MDGEETTASDHFCGLGGAKQLEHAYSHFLIVNKKPSPFSFSLKKGH